MKKYKLVSGFHQRFEGHDPRRRVTYRAGDTIELVKSEVEKLGQRVQPIVEFDEAADEEAENDEVVDEGNSVATDVGSGETVVEVETVLDDHGQRVKAHIRQMTDTDDLAALLQAESSGRSRHAVLQEIENRMQELLDEQATETRDE